MARSWQPPGWLFPHQVDAARRVAGALEILGGALLADAVGLGKTYVALAVATRYRRIVVTVPAALVPQWRRAAGGVGVELALVPHESLSRGAALPARDLLIVDEAHRFRNHDTRRYQALSEQAPRTPLLLVSATPVVNRAADLIHLLQLFLPDHGLSLLGIASLDGALDGARPADLAAAAAPLIVARSSITAGRQPLAVPRPRDSRVLRPPPLPAGDLRRVVPLLSGLEFPTFGDTPAAGLLRLHLTHRLASSVAACRVTLRRHRRYLERALAASRRGQTLRRGESRRLFGPDESPQLELDTLWPTAASRQLEVRAVEAELERIARLIVQLDAVGFSPKAEQLGRVLSARGGRKTIVFTTAIETGMDLARRLKWREVAVVSGHGARVASGRLPVEAALGLFAPDARRAGTPGVALPVSTLIATDLVSEGLDLQDADAIVHFDLPWTPLRLEQRLGRIARLGSAHREVDVWWFAPAVELDRELGLAARIAAKFECQLGLAVPTSSRVGRAGVGRGTLEWRERILGDSTEIAPGPRGFATVVGPAAAAFALEWITSRGPIPQLLMIAGEPPGLVTDFREIYRTMRRLELAPLSAKPPPASILCALHRLTRSRLAASAGPSDLQTRQLARLAVSRACQAARRRDVGLIALLDQALGRITSGIPVGDQRRVAGILGARRPAPDLGRWLAEVNGDRHEAAARVVVHAAILGDGTDR